MGLVLYDEHKLLPKQGPPVSAGELFDHPEDVSTDIYPDDLPTDHTIRLSKLSKLDYIMAINNKLLSDSKDLRFYFYVILLCCLIQDH